MNPEKKEEKITTFNIVPVKKNGIRPSIRFSDDSKISISSSDQSHDPDNSTSFPNTSRNRHVNWDNQTLEEQEIERKLNPKKKILEPKTPYLPFEEGDDEYLKKLNEINRLKPTVIKRLNSFILILNFIFFNIARFIGGGI
jgi:hypothetical protein